MVVRIKISKRRRGIKRRSFKKRRTYKKRSSMKMMVRREIARTIEDKGAQVYVGNLPIYSPEYPLFDSSNVIPLSPQTSGIAPQILQGVGNGARIGSKIKTKRLIFSGVIKPTPYDALTNQFVVPIQLRLIVLYDRRTPYSAPAPSTNLFQLNNGNSPILNNLMDQTAPINTEYYTVLAERRFKIGIADFVGPGSVARYSGYANNDFKLNVNFRMDLTKHMVKNVIFEGNSTQPTTRGLWAVLIPSYADGTRIPNTVIPVNMQYILDYKYEDA